MRLDLNAIGKNKFLRAVLVYGVGQTAMKGLDFIGFALLVRTLSVQELGFVGTMALFGFLVTDIASLGLLRIGVPRFFLDAEYERKDVLRSGLGGYLVYAGAAILLLWPASAATSTLAGSTFVVPFLLYMTAFLLRALVYMELEVLRMQERARLQASVETLPSLLNVIALIALLPTFENDLLASGVAQVLAWTPAFLWAAWLGVKRGGPSLKLVRPLLAYSVPLVVHRSMSELSQMGGRWAALILFGLTGAGAYTFLSRVGEIQKMALNPLQKAWMPVLIKGAQGDQEHLGKQAVMYITASTLFFLGFLVFFRLAASLVDGRGAYHAYYDLIPLVAAGAWITSFYLVFGVGFFVAKKPTALIPITAITAILNVGGSFALGAAFGLKAIPYAIILSSVFFATATQTVGRRYFSIQYKPAWWTAMACLTAGALAVAAEQVLANT